jgi:hypothetical protein
MMLKLYLGVLFSAATIWVSSPMNAATYYCTLKETGKRSGWVSVDMYVHVSSNKQEIVVEDAVIQSFGKQSVNAKVGDATAAGLAFRWSVDTRSTSNQKARIEYRATLSEDTMKIRVHARPTGYSNDFEGRGTCKQV